MGRWEQLAARAKALTINSAISYLAMQESVMNSRAAAQALVPGRVIMLADRSSGLTELGVVCGSVPAAKTGIQLGSTPAAGAPRNGRACSATGFV